jgi:hypothetical protein
MTTTTEKQLSVGDTYWIAEGSLSGQERVISEDRHLTKLEALQEADTWLAMLSEREQESATSWVSQWRVASLDEDGTIGEVDQVG